MTVRPVNGSDPDCGVCAGVLLSAPSEVEGART